MPAARKPRLKTAAAPGPAALLGAFLRENRTRFATDAAFAAAVGCSAGRLSQILSSDGLPRVRPQLAIAIHRETRGAVPGNALRPDLWRSRAGVPVGGNRQ